MKNILVCVLAAVGLAAVMLPPPMVHAAPIRAAVPFIQVLPASAGSISPMGNFGVRRVSVTSTAAAISAAVAPMVCTCSYVILNGTANALNVGGSDVDNTDKFTSVCSSGCDTANPIVITARDGVVFWRAASTTVNPAVIWCGGGC